MENKYQRFLDKHKKLFGFSDYIVNLKIKKSSHERGNILATVSVDYYEKVLDVSLYPNFFDKKTDKVNVLIHELIHARISMYREKFEAKVSQIEYEEEEDCVNDIARGVLYFGNR